LELIFADLETLEKKITILEKTVKSGDLKNKKEFTILKHINDDLENGIPVRNMHLDREETEIIKPLFLLTGKPVIYAANISEKDVGKNTEEMPLVQRVVDFAKKEGSEVVAVCAKIEEEIARLDIEEKETFMKEMGIELSGLDHLIEASYRLLGLISFLTAGPQEVRAWTIKKGDKAPRAAGKIHTDFERGFIRAEIVPCEKLIALGSFNTAKEKGMVKIEGKEYIVNDGDVVLFRFNV
ncbi:MAG TPA: redox-regulated ATPase YchF, partial [Actinobacteria bacterium]|nr:redox-regulated ATPase YchF [Actinomycetota bacterium]